MRGKTNKATDRPISGQVKQEEEEEKGEDDEEQFKDSRALGVVH